jgi:hypothetical protein
MMASRNYTLTRGDEQIDVTVDYYAEPFTPASWSDPAEGGAIEIEEVNSSTDRIVLTAEEDALLTAWLAERHEDDEQEYEPEDDYNGDY